MTKDNDWKEIEACFIRGRDDGKEYGVPTIVVNPDTLRVGIQSLLDRQREGFIGVVEDYFKGLVHVPFPELTKENLIARLRAQTTLKDKI